MSRIQHILEKAEREGYTRRAPALDIGPVGPISATSRNRLPGGSFEEVEGDVTDSATLTPARLVAGAQFHRSLVASLSTETAAAEQYRALRTRVHQADASRAHPVRVLLVTSPGDGEGKTLTAANLSLAMTQEPKRRICLVEADLRRPSLQQLFGLPDGPGLADLLAGQATLPEALLVLEEHQLTILPAGHVPAHAAELLGTTTMRRTVEALRQHFDRIVIDAPAAAPLADVGILTPLVDGILVVVRAGLTSRPSVRDTVAALDRSKLMGLVLNESA
jgi:capsular exopolysaccharide synthesis family protein